MALVFLSSSLSSSSSSSRSRSRSPFLSHALSVSVLHHMWATGNVESCSINDIVTVPKSELCVRSLHYCYDLLASDNCETNSQGGRIERTIGKGKERRAEQSRAGRELKEGPRMIVRTWSAWGSCCHSKIHTKTTDEQRSRYLRTSITRSSIFDLSNWDLQSEKCDLDLVSGAERLHANCMQQIFKWRCDRFICNKPPELLLI